MSITMDNVIKIAALITAAGTIIGVFTAIYKVIERDKRQSRIIEELQAEQLVICKGLRGALQGLIEQGCNGPCKEALSLLDEHLNHRAHNANMK